MDILKKNWLKLVLLQSLSFFLNYHFLKAPKHKQAPCQITFIRCGEISGRCRLNKLLAKEVRISRVGGLAQRHGIARFGAKHSKSMQYLCLKHLANPHECWILWVSQGRLARTLEDQASW
jgi:hypothetical protein